MIIIPAIDILGGKAVRLFKGDYDQVKVYSDNPAEFASEWEAQGADCIHLVDLDAAKEGSLVNLNSIKAIRETVKCELEYGGGVRSVEDVTQLIEIGINRVILGTKALDEDFLKELIGRFGGKIAVSVDMDKGFIKTGGWIEDSKVDYLDFCRSLESLGVETIVFTDISKDGTLLGPNLEALNGLLDQTKMKVIQSGGMSTIDDVHALLEIQCTNLYGVIIGKALYEKKIDLNEAICLTK